MKIGGKRISFIDTSYKQKKPLLLKLQLKELMGLLSFFWMSLNFLFCIGVVTISGEQQRDSAIHIQVMDGLVLTEVHLREGI